jgi:hypothetical protein
VGYHRQVDFRGDHLLDRPISGRTVMVVQERWRNGETSMNEVKGGRISCRLVTRDGGGRGGSCLACARKRLWIKRGEVDMGWKHSGGVRAICKSKFEKARHGLFVSCCESGQRVEILLLKEVKTFQCYRILCSSRGVNALELSRNQVPIPSSLYWFSFGTTRNKNSKPFIHKK